METVASSGDLHRDLPERVSPALLRKLDDKETCEAIMKTLSLVANPTRFRILCLLSEGRFFVNEIVQFVGGKTSNISQQLSILALAGYIRRERIGKQIYYELEEGDVRRLIEFLWKSQE